MEKTNVKLENNVLKNIITVDISAICCNLYTNDDKILLLLGSEDKWKSGWYDTPSGKYDVTKETIFDCLQRELFEETNLRLISKDGIFFLSVLPNVQIGIQYAGRVLNTKTPSGSNVLLDMFIINVDCSSKELYKHIILSKEHKSFIFTDRYKDFPDCTLALITYLDQVINNGKPIKDIKELI